MKLHRLLVVLVRLLTVVMPIINAAKETGTSVILLGMLLKKGRIAGPKILEHLVDVVLQFEGDRYGGFKIVRAVKNRYGSTNESCYI